VCNYACAYVFVGMYPQNMSAVADDKSLFLFIFACILLVMIGGISAF
jgi:hypothetical protein